MRGTVMYGPRDVRFEERPDPQIIEPTDAIFRQRRPVQWRSTRASPRAEDCRTMDERRAIKALLQP